MELNYCVATLGIPDLTTAFAVFEPYSAKQLEMNRSGKSWERIFL